MPSLTFFEHQARTYDELGLSPDHPLLTAIDELNERAQTEVIHLGRKNIKATSNVGVIRAGDFTVEVLPKIDYDPKGNPDAQAGTGAHITALNSASRNLLYLLSYTHGLQLKEQAIAELATQRTNWFEFLTRLFATDLHKQVQRGLHHQYVYEEETLPVIRGRWQISRQLTRRPQDRHKFDVSFDEFSPDTLLNRIFRYVVELLHIETRDTINRKLLLDLREWLVPAQLAASVPLNQLNEVPFTRLNEQFRPAFNLARLFLESSTFQFRSGQRSVFAFIFDMNILFEAFIAGFLQRHRDSIFSAEWRLPFVRVQAAGSSVYLAQKQPLGSRVFKLKPDMLLSASLQSKPFLVLDTKYKILNSEENTLSINESDMYQMLAYMVRYDCPRSLLLYPQIAGHQAVRSEYQIIDFPAQVFIDSVNLRVPLSNPKPLVDEFQNIFTLIGL